MRSRSASESRWSSSTWRREIRVELQPVAEVEPLGPLTVGGAEVADEPATMSASVPASASRIALGLRRPKKLPVCVSRKRGPGSYESPAKSSKSQPLVIVSTRPAPSARRLTDGIGDGRDGVGVAGHEPSDPLPVASFARTAGTRRAGGDWQRSSRAGRRSIWRRSRA